MRQLRPEVLEAETKEGNSLVKTIYLTEIKIENSKKEMYTFILIASTQLSGKIQDKGQGRTNNDRNHNTHRPYQGPNEKDTPHKERPERGI